MDLNITKGDYNMRDMTRYINQRITRGFANSDLWDMDEWFLEIIPNMLKVLDSKYQGVPNCIIDEYLQKNKDKYLYLFKDATYKEDVKEARKWCKNDDDVITYLFSAYYKDNIKRLDKFRKDFEEGCVALWHSILRRMIELFIKARGGGYDQKPDKIKAAEEGLYLFKKYFFCLNW